MTVPSTRLGLLKPATGDFFSTADLAANWQKLDDAPGVHICTSTTHPSSWGTNQIGRRILETDTGMELRWSGNGWINEQRVRIATSTSKPIWGSAQAGQLCVETDTGNVLRWTGTNWIAVRWGNDTETAQPWTMQVSTAWVWPSTMQRGWWRRHNGFVSGQATTALNSNPPYVNTLAIGLPFVGGPTAGTQVGFVSLTNYAGQLKNTGPLLMSNNGFEALLYGFPDSLYNITPANGDIVTATIGFQQYS